MSDEKKSLSALAEFLDDGLDIGDFSDLVGRLSVNAERGFDDKAPSPTPEPSSTAMSRLEQSSEMALLRLVERRGSGPYEGNAQFLSFSSAALLVDAAGLILSANDLAINQLAANDIECLDDIPIQLADGEAADTSLMPLLTGNRRFHLHAARHKDKDTPLTVTSLRLEEADGAGAHFLIIVVEPPWNDATAAALSERFALTPTETNILESFVEGQTLKKIASDRGRSYATIRNQFQSILEKTGCTNQVELLRMLIGVSFLFSELESLAQPVHEQQDRSLTVMRPHNRVISLRLVGAPEGRPFIFLPSVFAHSVTPAISNALSERGLLMISIDRPGMGGTSSPAGEELRECIKSDLASILDSRGIEKCPIMARASASRVMFGALIDLPDRFERGVVVNGVVPSRFVRPDHVPSPWTKSLMTSMRNSPGVARVILWTGARLMLRIGTEAFMRKMYAKSAHDQLALSDPEVLKSIREGLLTTIKQGTGAGMTDMFESFADWAELAKGVVPPVTFVHGVSDPHVPLEAVERFVAYLGGPHKLSAVEGGGLLNYSHMAEVFAPLTPD